MPRFIDQACCLCTLVITGSYPPGLQTISHFVFLDIYRKTIYIQTLCIPKYIIKAMHLSKPKRHVILQSQNNIYLERMDGIDVYQVLWG